MQIHSVLVRRQAVCIEIVLCARMTGHGRHVEILYMPKFSVDWQNSAASCFPEYTIPPRLLEFCTLSGIACPAKHNAQYGFGDMCANNVGKHNIFLTICVIRVFLTQQLARKHYGHCHFTDKGELVGFMSPAIG